MIQEEKKISLHKKAVPLLFLAAVFLFASAVLAQAPPPAGGLELGLSYAQATGLADADIRVIIAKIIRAFLGLLGIIAVGFTIYGGFMYMTAGGNEEKIATAKKILVNMAIGLAIILSAFGIVQFVITSLYNAYYAQVTEGLPEAPGEIGLGVYLGGGGLGTVIESHYPKRDAPLPGEPPIWRNISIIITFKQRMVSSSLALDSNNNRLFGDAGAVPDQVNADNIKIFVTAEGITKSLGTDPNVDADDVYAATSGDGKNLVLQPKNLLGNPTANTNYTVRLTNGIRIDDGSTAGKTAFDRLGGYYEWRFTVSNLIDVDPPYVVSIVPVAGSEQPINIISQINFSEPVNPITASGLFKSTDPTRTFRNLTVEASPLAPVGSPLAPTDGEFKISNNYQTVEFVPDNPCGKNACGQTIYCLPLSSNIKVTAKAPTLAPTASQPFKAALAGSYLYNGVVDLAANALDGEAQLDAGGRRIPPAEDYAWQFRTSDQKNTDSPSISAITPGPLEPNVVPEAPLTATFVKPMSVSTFSNILFKTSHGPIWYYKTAENQQANGLPVTNPTQVAAGTKVIINHAPLFRSTSTPPNYYPFLLHTITDIYQNCFYPAVGPSADDANTGDYCTPANLRDDGINLVHSCYNGEKKESVSTCETGDFTGSDCPYGPTSGKDAVIKNESP